MLGGWVVGGWVVGGWVVGGWVEGVMVGGVVAVAGIRVGVVAGVVPAVLGGVVVTGGDAGVERWAAAGTPLLRTANHMPSMPCPLA